MIVLVLPLLAGYIVLVERKVMAHMQARLGPMRVGPHGLLQPLADALKLLLKEDMIPARADRLIFWFAPVISVTVALVAYSALPIGPAFQIADLNVGLLFIVAVSSLGIYGIVLGGWSSNSHYSLLGAMRSAAQLVSYEVAAGLALVSVLLLAGSLSMKEIVQAQLDQGVWFIFYVPFGFFIYLVASIAETNRAPFDLPEADSEIVAGYMTEFSGFRWSLYFLAEYANLIIVAGVATTLFLGGWLRPLTRYRDHFPGTSIELLDVVPTLLLVALAWYCLRLAPGQPVKVQKSVMAGVAGACFGIAAILLGALFAPDAVRQGIHGAFWFLLQSRRLHLLLHVVPVFVSALPVRPIDAPKLAVPDSVGAGERDRSEHRDCAARAMGLESVFVAGTDDAGDAWRSDVAHRRRVGFRDRRGRLGFRCGRGRGIGQHGAAGGW